jgi:hypothetical protein
MVVASWIAAGGSRSTVLHRAQSAPDLRLCSSSIVGGEAAGGVVMDLSHAVGRGDGLGAVRC